jgi:gluconolactonase
MWKISNYSLNYSREFAAGRMDLGDFLALSRQLGVDGVSLHVTNLPETGRAYLRRLRRDLLENGLSLAMFTVTTDFGRAPDVDVELAKAREAVAVASFLGAPLLRVFAGSPPQEGEREAAFARAVEGVRSACNEAGEHGIPVGLQNHNHGALCRTGEEIVRFLKEVNHPNLTFVLDTGQFAGSPGASAGTAGALADADYLESIRMTAPLARHVRVKFYEPRADGSDAALDYGKILDMLRGVHYAGFLDIVYEGSRVGEDESVRSALPRVVAFLQAQAGRGVPMAAQPAEGPPADRGAERYGALANDRYFAQGEVAGVADAAFLEGPACDRAGRVFFTNIPAERIMLWDPAAAKLSVFREPSKGANGLAFDRQGRLLACEGEAGRITRTDLATGKIEVVADKFEGGPLGGVNDLALDRRGRIYFTSRFGTDLKPGQVNAVYRLDPDGTLARILATPAIDMPNGIVTSPDDKVLYLIDADPRANFARRIRAYALRDDGTLADERTLIDFYPGRSGDGMAIDAQGNLYVAAGLHRRRGTSETLDTRPGIHVVSPQGKIVGFLPTPEDTITNCAFGGADLKTLYITCGKKLLSVATRIPGKADYLPEK